MELLTDIKFIYFSFSDRKTVQELVPMVLPYMDLTCLLSGEMTYVYNGQRAILHSGDAILFPPGSERIRMKADIPVRYASFNVLLPQAFDPPLRGHLKGCITPTVPVILDMFLTEWNSPTQYSAHQQCMLFNYLYTHLREAMVHRENPYVATIRKYIHQNLSEPLRLDTIAEAVHLAPEYCCALFRRHTGKTIVTYLTERRMDAAKRLFQLGNHSVAQVAERVGFHDTAYFSKLFRKTTGMSPTAYCKLKTEHPPQLRSSFLTK